MIGTYLDLEVTWEKKDVNKSKLQEQPYRSIANIFE